MTTSLRDWVKGGLTKIYTPPPPSEPTFDDIFDAVVSKDVTITINNETWTRDDFKRQVEACWTPQSKLIIGDVVDVPFDPVCCEGMVGVSYQVICPMRGPPIPPFSKRPTTQHRIFATANAMIRVDPNVQPTDMQPDPRRIMTINESRLEGFMFPSRPDRGAFF